MDIALASSVYQVAMASREATSLPALLIVFGILVVVTVVAGIYFHFN